MKAVRLLAALGALILVGCGDGSIKSPEFSQVTTLTSLTLEQVDPTQSTSIPAGTTIAFRAIGRYSFTVPPGQLDSSCDANHRNPDGTCWRETNVTDSATWTSSNDTVASVDKGIVTGKSPSATPVTITAALEGKQATAQVTVTAATLQYVTCIAPIGVACTATGTHSYGPVPAGNTQPFAIWGHFSNGMERPLSPDTYPADWASSDTAVAENTTTTTNYTFATHNAGTAQITGTLNPVPASVTGDASAQASLSVTAPDQICNGYFLQSTGALTTTSKPPASPLCLGCSVSNPNNAIDGDSSTSATLNIPLGLLTLADVSLTVYNPTVPLVNGQSVGFVVSKDAGILSAELLDTLSISTYQCTSNDASSCTLAETFTTSDPGSSPLSLSLLGLIGGVPQYLVQTAAPISKPANGIALTYGKGVLAVLGEVNVQSACSSVPAASP